MKEHLRDVSKVLDELDTSIEGLSSSEAEKRLQKHGKNALKEEKKTPLIVRFLQQLKEPMLIILIVAAVISGITSYYEGESYADVIIIMFVVLLNAILGVVQESKAEKAIAALKKITAATSKVIRDGHQITIKSDDLVVGDIIVLEAGDSVPADARIIESASLKAEEAPLTGESVPVNKYAEAIIADENADIPLGDRKNMVYMGCTVVYGRGLAVVTGTGMDTEIGKIADALASAKEGQTPLQRKLGQLSKILTFLVLGICAVVFLIDFFRYVPEVSGKMMLNTFMLAVSLAVAAIPEGLATVVTIVLSIGVTNMSKRRAVIRKLTAVETLGCTQVICSDKTGTLTQNKMTVVETSGGNDGLLACAMALCSDANIEEKDDGSATAVGEPTECALVNYAYKNNIKKKDLNNILPRVNEIPFESIRKMMTTFHENKIGEERPNFDTSVLTGKIISFTKGAPDQIIDRCSHVLIGGKVEPMTDKIKKDILTDNKKMANKALRVLAAAFRVWEEVPNLNSEDATDIVESGMCFIGLTGMIDPVREEVAAAIEECRSAGIRPIMITGDHLDTAVAIAKELGIIKSEAEAITGAQLNTMSDEEFERNIEKYSVYARVQPEHKVRIVKAWQKKGKITSMTGDGVNDAPSMKSADIGVGMGITGTDVTKNVADMVLADDNFATIVIAVEEGRKIYDNIRKSIQFLLASNLSEVLTIFFATILGFVIFKPVHLLWINLITDSFPALALGMEHGEEDLMKKPPREPNEGLFANGVGFDVIFQGAVVAVITLFSYIVGHYIESGSWQFVNSADGTTMAFLTLSMAEIFHSFNVRSLSKSIFSLKKQNKYLLLAMAVSFILTTAVIYVPFLSNAFGFESISFVEYLIAMGLAFCIIPIVEIEKLIKRKLKK